MKEIFAKWIRVITVPPVLALSMLLILRRVFGDFFASIPSLAETILFLSVIPACAYPAVGFKGGEDARNRQRKLAFALNLVGYTGALLLAIIDRSSRMLLAITSAYFTAVLLLTILNKAFHIKASGHACSCVLPFLFLIYWLGPGAAAACILIYMAEFWASVSLKRHTVREFLLGTITALATFSFIWRVMLRE